MKTKHFDDSLSLHGRAFSRIRMHGSPDDSYLEGEVVTPSGIVSVYSQGSGSFDPHSRLDFVANGRLVMRNINRRLTQRGLAIAASKFVKEFSVRK